MHSVKSKSLSSRQVDYALRQSHRHPQQRSWMPVTLFAIALSLGATTLLLPQFTDEEPTYISQSEIDTYFGPELLADASMADTVIEAEPVAEAAPMSPIQATNIATTLFYGPPQHFEILPEGRVTEVTVKKGDTLGIIFNDMGIGATTLHKILELDLADTELQKIYPGQKLTFVTDSNGLKQIRYPHSANETFVINKAADEISVDLVERPREIRKNYATADISDSLYMSAKKANIDINIIMELTEIFEYDIDFYLDIKRGDSFKVMYEEYYVDGEKVGNGPILAAEFNSQGKNYQVVRYTDQDGRIQYYTADGLSLRKAFIRSPVEYARISSHFNLARKHPILHKIRAHKGVDYAAPQGTPIRATGDGKVIFKGRRGGYGNVIEIQHGSRYQTLYAHMNGFATGLNTGSRVDQGQVIGYVGSTGLASGPHLHYEFKVDGVQKDPVKLDLPMADPLPKAEKKTFMLHASNMFDELDYYDQILLAQAPVTKPKTRDQG